MLSKSLFVCINIERGVVGLITFNDFYFMSFGEMSWHLQGWYLYKCQEHAQKVCHNHFLNSTIEDWQKAKPGSFCQIKVLNAIGTNVTAPCVGASFLMSATKLKRLMQTCSKL